jgi:hypothetical protein
MSEGEDQNECSWQIFRSYNHFGRGGKNKANQTFDAYLIAKYSLEG